MDVHSKAVRSYNMSRIRSRGTMPELKLKMVLKKQGFIYQPKGVYGRPDFIQKKKRIVIFIDGCFWHGCPYHYVIPKTNTEYWDQKIRRNILRDHEVKRHLRKEGWTVIRIWEHQTKRLKYILKKV